MIVLVDEDVEDEGTDDHQGEEEDEQVTA